MNIPMTTAIDKIYPDIQWNLKESSMKDTKKKQNSKEEIESEYAERKEKLIRMLGYQRKYSHNYYAEQCNIGLSTASRWIREHEVKRK